jgi:hypothetical protein
MLFYELNQQIIKVLFSHKGKFFTADTAIDLSRLFEKSNHTNHKTHFILVISTVFTLRQLMRNNDK